MFRSLDVNRGSVVDVFASTDADENYSHPGSATYGTIGFLGQHHDYDSKLVDSITVLVQEVLDDA